MKGFCQINDFLPSLELRHGKLVVLQWHPIQLRQELADLFVIALQIPDFEDEPFLTSNRPGGFLELQHLTLEGEFRF